jgi:Fuc2NAc and GlcNAc transferase
VQPEPWSWALASCLVAVALTKLARMLALRLAWLDVPNRRSSHAITTPRGGGIALVVVILVAVAYGLDQAGTPPWVVATLSVAAVAVASIGLVDDFRPLSIPVRLAVQVIAVAAGLAAIGGIPYLEIGGLRIVLGPLGQLLVGVACVWFVNLYNFMDGIDGIAAAEAAFVGLMAAWLVSAPGSGPGLSLAWAGLGGASLGFLVWNWAPARIFMGDVGSGFLGFAIAMLLVHSIHEERLSTWTAIVLVAPFLVDTTLTLVRRMARREKWYLAHRTHAYQWLARRWGSHSRVTLLSLLVNLLVIAPAAVTCQRLPAVAPLIAGLVLAVLSVALWRAGAGRQEIDATEING